jgi:Rne/Rng family ribonuclease
MPKELYISSSPHETKVAVLDDDQLVEVYYERDTDVGLVGGIYKGRVNRVLPGMQSAFVDIGLERDAFLYVSDFFEDAEEYDKVVAEAEARVSRMPEKGGFPQAPPPAELAEAAEPAGGEEPPPAEALAETPAPPTPAEAQAAPSPQQEAAAAPPVESPVAPPPTSTAAHAPDRSSGDRSRDFRGERRGGRHRRRRGRHFDDRRFPKRESRERPAEPSSSHEPSGAATFEILPGESLAKYSHRPPEATPVAEEAPPAPEPSLSEEHIEAAGAEVPVAAESAAVESAAPAQAEPEAPQPAAIPSEESFAPREPEAAAPPAEPAVQTPLEPPAPVPSETQEKRPLWNRFVSTVFGETPRATEEEPESIQAAPVPVAEPPQETAAEPEEHAEEAESPSEPKEVSRSPEESAAPAAEEAAGEGEPAAAPEPSEQPSAPEPSGEPAERSYTLREPSQRPHFAPRRRRGRRGRGGHREFRSSTQPQRQESRPGNNQPVQISELLKEGQEILVQIAKEPLGRKGARITSHIALPGRYLVYMPTVDHIGVSRKIASEEERLRLKNLILENKGAIPGGFIVRTAGAGKPDDELKDDMRFLSTLWSDIRRKAESSKAPALLHADLNLVQRILRDILSPDFKTVWLDSEMEYARTVEFVNRCQPSLVGHVKLYTKPTPMFEQFGIEPEIEKALKPKVWLKSGGYIVINQTEALVAIDVNTGKYVGKTNRLEDTIVKTNIDAVNEIVRQIRMRDLGGIIVIDFIDMDERRNRNKVVQALEEALRKDRAPTKILSFNDFGLVAVTRKRVKQSLERTLCEPCSYCSGAGWVKSVSTVCHEILAEAKKMAADLEGDVVTLRVNPEVARALKSREGLVLGELESLLRKNVIVKSDESVHQERFEICGA